MLPVVAVVEDVALFIEGDIPLLKSKIPRLVDLIQQVVDDLASLNVLEGLPIRKRSNMVSTLLSVLALLVGEGVGGFVSTPMVQNVAHKEGGGAIIPNACLCNCLCVL